MRFAKLFAPPLAAALILPAAAIAAPPPAGALKLSDIVTRVEAHAADLAYIDEVKWDDKGYWEVEYKNAQGAEIDLRVDPVSGTVTPDR